MLRELQEQGVEWNKKKCFLNWKVIHASNLEKFPTFISSAETSTSAQLQKDKRRIGVAPILDWCKYHGLAPETNLTSALYNQQKH